MSRRDRTALVISFFYILGVWVFGATVGFKFLAGLVFCTPLLVYWSYRFIRNDISFLRVKEK